MHPRPWETLSLTLLTGSVNIVDVGTGGKAHFKECLSSIRWGGQLAAYLNLVL